LERKAKLEKEEADMAAAEIQAGKTTYTGKAAHPTVQVQVNGRTLLQGADFELEYTDAVDAGTAELTVTGKGNYTGSATGEFTISPKSLENAKVSEIGSQAFTGGAIEPAVEVSCDGKALEAGTDFNVVYKKNTEVGTAKAVVKGTGNYAGKTSVKFKIKPRSIRKAAVSPIPGQKSDDDSGAPALQVTDDGELLERDVDYRVVYLPNEDGGYDKAIVKGIGNYKDTQTIDIKVSTPGEALARAACVVSYSHGQYYGGGTHGAYPATALWQKVYSQVNPGSMWMRGCVTTVKVVVRWAGFDDSFPSPPNNPSTMYQNHLKSRSDVWAIVGTWDGNISSLEPGDILTVQRNGVVGASGSDHSMMYVGHEIASEIYEEYLKGTDADLGAPNEDEVFVSSHGAGNPQSNRSSAPCICNARFALAYAYGKNAYVIIRPISGPNVEGSKYANVMPEYRPF
ncbi:MAG: hypothetical protein Q4C36_09115, partial [Coriobacteriia bacterium]|nr:hypothetical protein [Coriobacteriia bacterium]